MDISNDFIRRELRESRAEQAAAMAGLRSLLGRVFGGGSPQPAAAKADLLLGGLDRRGFFRMGGVTIAAAAVFGACGGDEPATVAAQEEEEDAPVSRGDINILRTATSLELVAVDVYKSVAAGGLVTTPAVREATTEFAKQHQAHADLLKGHTVKAGGQAYDRPNPTLLASLQPALAALTSQAGVLALALDIETAAAHTYQASVSTFTDKGLNRIAMSIGGIEARHVAVLRAAGGQTAVTEVFQTTPRAVPTSAAV